MTSNLSVIVLVFSVFGTDLNAAIRILSPDNSTNSTFQDFELPPRDLSSRAKAATVPFESPLPNPESPNAPAWAGIRLAKPQSPRALSVLFESPLPNPESPNAPALAGTRLPNPQSSRALSVLFESP